MNEIKVSTQIKSPNEQKLTLKIDAKALGLNWALSDTIRVKCYPAERRIVLEKVAKKHSKQIAYNITSMGSGEFSHKLGIYVTQKRTRFSTLGQSKTIGAAARMLNARQVEIHLPQEIFNK